MRILKFLQFLRTLQVIDISQLDEVLQRLSIYNSFEARDFVNNLRCMYMLQGCMYSVLNSVSFGEIFYTQNFGLSIPPT